MLVLRDNYYSSPLIMDEDEYLEKMFTSAGVRVAKRIAKDMDAKTNLANIIHEGIARIKAGELNEGRLHGFIKEKLPGLKINKKDLNRQINAVKEAGYENVNLANRIEAERSVEKNKRVLNNLFEGANNKNVAQKIQRSVNKSGEKALGDLILPTSPYHSTGTKNISGIRTRSQNSIDVYNPLERAVIHDSDTEYTRKILGGKGSKTPYWAKAFRRAAKKERAELRKRVNEGLPYDDLDRKHAKDVGRLKEALSDYRIGREDIINGRFEHKRAHSNDLLERDADYFRNNSEYLRWRYGNKY